MNEEKYMLILIALGIVFVALFFYMRNLDNDLQKFRAWFGLFLGLFLIIFGLYKLLGHLG